MAPHTYVIAFVLLFLLGVTYSYPTWVLDELVVGQWAPPNPGDVRGPCPGLNTLANHGFIPRNGMNITVSDLTTALEHVYNLSSVLASALALNGIAVDGQNGELDLDELNNHFTIEHDASMTRSDYYWGDNHDLNVTLLQGLLLASSDGNVLSLDDFAAYQSIRQNDSSINNPTYTFGIPQQVLASGEPALVLAVFGNLDDSDYTVPLSSIKSFFGLEKLPDGWTAAAVEVDLGLITELSAEIQAAWSS